MINIPTLYFCRSDLYRRSHVATSLSRENPQISIVHSSCIHQNPTIHRNKTYLLNQWMDLMYLSTLDLPGSLISESRTSALSSSQVSWLHQHVLTLYTTNPRMYSPYTQTTRICTHPIHRQTYALENRVLCESENFVVNPSCYLRRSPLQMYPQVFTRSFT
jgi:hypothetical protein